MQGPSPDQPKRLSRGRKLLFTLVSIFLFAALILILGEVVVRLAGVMSPPPDPPPPYNTMEKDPELGWRVKADYHWQGAMTDKAGNTYPVDFNTEEDGFRVFGDTASALPKVFFLGDSYTQSVEVSDSKTYYQLVGDSLPIEVFAYGASGYGTFQEYLILEQYLDRIQPDIVVLQVCNNDFIDNYCALELEAGYRVKLRRPYLTLKGEVTYQRAVSTYERIQELSRFIKLLDSKLRGLYQRLWPSDPVTAETHIYDQGRAYEKFDHSVRVTARILELIGRKVDGTTRLIGFPSDIGLPNTDVFQELFQTAGLAFYRDPGQAVHDADYFGQAVKSSDGYHWNEAGHQLVAAELINILSDTIQDELLH